MGESGSQPWDTIFDGAVPSLGLADDPALRSTPAIVRRLIVELAEVASALSNRLDPTGPLELHADVLVVDGPVDLVADRLVIHARRVEVRPGATLTVRRGDDAGPACRVEISFDEWEGETLPLTVLGLAHGIDAGLSGTTLTVDVDVDDGGSASVVQSPTVVPGDAALGTIELDAARRLAHRPDLDDKVSTGLAVSIADWVARTSPDRLLADDARGYAALAASPRGRRHHVPVVHLDGYLALAESAATTLGQVELHVGQVVEETTDLAARTKAAESLLRRYRSEKEFSDRLLERSYAETTEAVDAVEAAQALLRERRTEIEAAEVVFRQGVDDKQSELESAAVWGIVGAVVGVAAGVAAVVLTAGAAAPAAAGTAAAAGQVAKAGAETAEKMNRLIELIKKIADLLDAIQKLMAYFTLLAGVFEDIADNRDARASAEAAGQGLPEPPTDADLMSAADWDEFEVTLEAAFGPALEFEIDGAVEYLASLKKLAIRGRDYTAKRDELDRSQRLLQQHLWQTMRDEELIAQAEADIAELDADRGPGLALLGFGGRLRDRLKYRLIGAIVGLADAYRYEALTEPSFRPSIADTGFELMEEVTDARDALLRAKTERGAVGTWTDRAPVSGEVVSSLRRSSSAGWSIGLGSFPGFERVRIGAIEVWLDGDLGVDRLHVVVTTSGDYLDRRRGKVFEFSTRPLERVFAYEYSSVVGGAGGATDPWGRSVWITSRADDAEGEFFQPSAFSTWRIELPERLNPDLRPDAIADVEVRFVGTALPDLRQRGGQGLDENVLASLPLTSAATPKPEPGPIEGRQLSTGVRVL